MYSVIFWNGRVFTASFEAVLEVYIHFATFFDFYLQKSASIQPRTGLVKFGNFGNGGPGHAAGRAKLSEEAAKPAVRRTWAWPCSTATWSGVELFAARALI